ncbi:family 20 glycosylhydrolase [Pontibacter qinzhouensis]|uniref:beta-N-acetylhexosaminidase n=1 Tax=Pontibacter qinzhouensis TaxID=2603253 RepID=A0A5C8IZE0_9BACT|nr:family 20 glycosylhydrolase [Pontibacter qinzhouensis]TXK26311.1 family 20 glycosylhydrolase [Pontibacter qinzhouensis]
MSIKKVFASLATIISVAHLFSGAIPAAYAQQNTARQQTISVIPKPVKLTQQIGNFVVRSTTKIYVDPKNDQLKAIGLSLAQELKKVSAIAPEVVQGQPTSKTDNYIYLTLTQPIDTLGQEGYNLKVQPAQIVLAANTPQGIFLGTQTIRQLLPTKGAATMVSIPAVEIADKPRYSWRGMHLDVSRHFFPVEFVKKYIDYLAMHKMNTFHWHLTDDQGWRIEIKKYPKLTEVGGYREGTLIGHYSDQPHQFDNKRYGGYYTQEQIKEVVKYAQERYVTVVPEIEMPGHAVAALTAYPELSCTGGPFKVEGLWGVFDDVFCAGNEQTFQFLEDVMTEVIALFPSKIIHIGGDESPKVRWKECPKCQKRIATEKLKDEHELQSYFVQRMEKFLNAKGRTIIGWDEILEGGLAPNAYVMSWQGTEGGIAAAKQNHYVVMTPGSHVYFNYYQGEASLEPLSIGGYVPLRKVYSFEPTPDELSESEKKYILGAQANLWSEYIHTTDEVEYMVLPRMSALAEVLWTPAKQKNWDDFTARMQQQYKRYDAMGATYAKSAFNVVQKITTDTTQRAAIVSFQTDANNPPIYYTLDGSEPTSQSMAYTAPFPLKTSAVVKAASFTDGKMAGKVSSSTFEVHKAFAKPVKLKNQPYQAYQGEGPVTLVNGMAGSKSHTDGQWLGFLGTDLEVVIDLQKETPITSISSSYLQYDFDKIFLPTTIEYEVSKDGKKYKKLKTFSTDADAQQQGSFIKQYTAEASKTKARFVKVTAKNAQAPDAKTPNTWLFIDEIIVK